MPRRLRIQGEGMIHHVLARGNSKSDIFKTDADRDKYLDLIRKYKTRYQFKLYAYCLMNNHIHLLIEEGEVNLSKIMQGIQQSYTQYLNKKHNRTGHVFEQRYKAIPCSEDSYFEKLIAYIHMNPVKAGLANYCKDYQWSGHHEIIHPKENSIIDSKDLFSLIEGKKGIQNYIEIINNHSLISEDHLDNIYLKKEEMEEKLDHLYFKERKTISRKSLTLVELAEIIDEFIEKEKIRVNKFSYNKIFVPLAYKEGKLPRGDIASFLGLSPSRACNINREYEEGRLDSKIDKMIETLDNRIAGIHK